jgi:hypothetical protein
MERKVMKKQSAKLRVEFIDDDDAFLEEWRVSFLKHAPKDLIQLEHRTRDQIRDAVKVLDNSRRKARMPKGTFDPDATYYSEADITVIDYDLLALEDTTCLTGEDIAYLLRCFSRCGLIILLNPPDLGTAFFDLRLRSSMDSWSDLVLGSDQLDNPWLWKAAPEGFAPWSWPDLAEAVVQRRTQIEDLNGSLGKPILDAIGLSEAGRLALDHEMADVVSQRNLGGSEPKKEQYKISEFVLDSGYCVHRRDRAALQKAEGQLVRIAASRISSWLERCVLPAQSVLVDAPHLVSRLPGLLAGNPLKPESWNLTVSRNDTVLKHIRRQEIDKQRFQASHWMSRPVWNWPEIVSHNKYFEWAHMDKDAELVFCEDVSCFVKKSKARVFMADVPAQFALRYVEMPKPGKIRTSYRPSVRLSM